MCILYVRTRVSRWDGRRGEKNSYSCVRVHRVRPYGLGARIQGARVFRSVCRTDKKKSVRHGAIVVRGDFDMVSDDIPYVIRLARRTCGTHVPTTRVFRVGRPNSDRHHHVLGDTPPAKLHVRDSQQKQIVCVIIHADNSGRPRLRGKNKRLASLSFRISREWNESAEQPPPPPSSLLYDPVRSPFRSLSLGTRPRPRASGS